MKFDLTTSEGIKKAKSTIKLLGFPSLYIVEKIFDFFSNDNTIKEQRQTAIDLIKAGKESDADEIELIIEQEAGINISSETNNIPIKVKIGKDGKMNIKVKYK